MSRSSSGTWSLNRSLAFLAAIFAIMFGSLLPTLAGPNLTDAAAAGARRKPDRDRRGTARSASAVDRAAARLK